MLRVWSERKKAGAWRSTRPSNTLAVDFMNGAAVGRQRRFMNCFCECWMGMHRAGQVFGAGLHRHVVANSVSSVTGYRQGTKREVTQYCATLIEDLNLRTIPKKKV